MAYKVALFDIDGTLSNPGNALIESAQYALEKMGVIETNEANLRRFVGPPLRHSFMEYYGFSEEKAFEAENYYRQNMRDEGVKLTTAYDGIDTLLQDLQAHGLRLAVVTSKIEDIANKALEITGLERFFEYVAAERPGEAAKKAATLERALDVLSIDSKTDVVMIGDRRHDIEAANTAGVDSIGVLWGYGDQNELTAEGATHIVSRPSEILPIILGK